MKFDFLLLFDPPTPISSAPVGPIGPTRRSALRTSIAITTRSICLPPRQSGGSHAQRARWNGLRRLAAAATNLVSDIQSVRAQGRKVILSIGGAQQNVTFDNRTRSQAFVDSMAGIYAQLGGCRRYRLGQLRVVRYAQCDRDDVDGPATEGALSRFYHFVGAGAMESDRSGFVLRIGMPRKDGFSAGK